MSGIIDPLVCTALVCSVHAIGRLIRLIQNCRLQGQSAGVIFIDLRKAFDSVDQRLLIDRMVAIGINADVVGYFESFLAGRKFISSRAIADSGQCSGSV